MNGRPLVDVAPTRRRPAGGPEPLQRPIYTSGRVYVALTAMLVAGWALVAAVPPLSSAVANFDREAAQLIASRRGGFGEAVGRSLGVLADDWIWRILRWGTIVALLVFRRFRHLAVYGVITLIVTAATNLIAATAARPVPAEALGDVERWAHPSRPVVELGISLVGVMYTMLPHGRVRNTGKSIAAGVMAALVASRLLLTAEHVTDIVAALLIGMALPVIGFRYLAPHDAFPIRYGRRSRGLALGAARLDAIAVAIEQGFGWQVDSVAPLRMPGSSGSTPMRIVIRRVDDAGVVVTSSLFGKLYSRSHLRADRWYKVGRVILYGRLEDEAPFADIRHMVEHEDYMLRVASDGGLPVPRSIGVVELSSGREYLLLMEDLGNARQLGRAVCTPDIARQAFDIVARLWSAGIAHRDIKPANLVVEGGRLHLVDLSFAELRPSAWRQAVDLGNMLLVCALSSSVDVAVSAAFERFSRDELAEALSATRSVTIPAQLRHALAHDDPDLAARCAQRTGVHTPIRVQRWTVARVALVCGAGLVTAAAFLLLAYNLEAAGLR